MTFFRTYIVCLIRNNNNEKLIFLLYILMTIFFSNSFLFELVIIRCKTAGPEGLGLTTLLKLVCFDKTPCVKSNDADLGTALHKLIKTSLRENLSFRLVGGASKIG